MEQNVFFDIFISYKRKSQATANNLYYRLTTRGYSTFFDLEEMRRDNFDTQLLKYIDNAKDVFIILEEGSLDSAIIPADGTSAPESWEKDWFCYEIFHALGEEKNIIPVLIGGYKMPKKESLPEELQPLTLKHSPEFSFAFFDEYLDKLIEKGFILSSPMNEKDRSTSIFKFFSNMDCEVYKEGKLVCMLIANSEAPFYLAVDKGGEYRFSAKNSESEEKTFTESITDNEEKIIDIVWKKKNRLIAVWQQVLSNRIIRILIPSIIILTACGTKLYSWNSNPVTQYTKGESAFNKQNYGSALNHFQKAADADYVDAWRMLGWMYEMGYGVETNYKEALLDYLNASELGDNLSLIYIGDMYRNGKYFYDRGFFEPDYKRAYDYYKKAADAGNADAMKRIGDLYYSGEGFDKDLEEAKTWYENAADAGSAGAWNSLGLMYERGETLDRPDYSKAWECYVKAGSEDADSNIERLWQQMTSEDQIADDLKKVEDQALAESGDVDAMYRLGNQYRIEKDFENAMDWYLKAANAGNANAMNSIGWLYENGYGDYSEAMNWYLKAADAGTGPVSEYASESIKRLNDRTVLSELP